MLKKAHLKKTTKNSIYPLPYCIRYFFCTVICLFVVPLQAQFVIKDTTLFDAVSLHPYAKIADVGVANLTLQQIINNETYTFTTLTNSNQDLGFTSSHFWITFTINNQTTNTVGINTAQIKDLTSCFKCINSPTI